MSKFDNCDLKALASCCVGTIQQRPELGTEGDATTCTACGRELRFTSGVWTRG